MSKITVLHGNDGKYFTFRAKGIVAYSPEDLAAKLGVAVDDLSIQIDWDAHHAETQRLRRQRGGRIADGVADFSPWPGFRRR
jgi:hypothetical protein